MKKYICFFALLVLILLQSSTYVFAQSEPFLIYSSPEASATYGSLNEKGDTGYMAGGQVFAYSFATGQTLQITNNYYSSYGANINESGQILWSGPQNPSSDWSGFDIFRYDGLDGNGNPMITNISNTGPWGYASRGDINNLGDVVYCKNYQVFVFNESNGTTTQISQISRPNSHQFPRISDNGMVAYKATDMNYQWGVYIFDPSTGLESRISSQIHWNSQPIINSQGQVVWYGMDNKSYLYTPGSGVSLVSTLPGVHINPDINDLGQITWVYGDGNFGGGVMLFDGISSRVISPAIAWEGQSYPVINNRGDVLFGRGGYNANAINLFYYPYDGTTENDIQQLTFWDVDYYVFSYQMNGSGDLIFGKDYSPGYWTDELYGMTGLGQ